MKDGDSKSSVDHGRRKTSSVYSVPSHLHLSPQPSSLVRFSDASPQLFFHPLSQLAQSGIRPR